MARTKIAVVGAGNVGATCAQRLAERDYADIALIDVVPGLAAGKALDILQAGPVEGYDSMVWGSHSWDLLSGSDVVVVTAGAARKPGMSRDDLLMTNMRIVSSVAKEIRDRAPEAIIVAVTNPLDAMAHLIYQVTGFSKNRVIGMAGLLDTARYRTFIAQELGVSVKEVFALLLGSHGDEMVPLPRLTTVGGVPVTELLPAARIDEIVQRTRQGGAEIVSLLGSGSAYYAPSAAVTQMVDSIVLDKKQVIPCSVLLEGEYGYDGIFLGVPVKIGADGAEQILDLELTAEEKEALDSSASEVTALIESIKKSAKT